MLFRDYGSRDRMQVCHSAALQQLPASLLLPAVAFLRAHLLWGCWCWGRLLLLISKCPRKAGICFFVSGRSTFACVCVRWPPGVTVVLCDSGGKTERSVSLTERIWRIILLCMFGLLMNVDIGSSILLSSWVGIWHPYCFCTEIILVKGWCIGTSKAIGKQVSSPSPTPEITHCGLSLAASYVYKDPSWSPASLSQMVHLPGTDCRMRPYIC